MFFGAPMGANVKSLVWYSPKAFQAGRLHGADHLGRDDHAVGQDRRRSGQKPWCAGIESGTATGWIATDWMEEVMLRMHGPDVYDQWVRHKFPFNDPKVLAALAKVGHLEEPEVRQRRYR